MRAVIVRVALAVLAATPAMAQGSAGAAKAKELQGDYAVPDAPALLMLTIDGSKLLRPSSARELATNLANSTKDFSFIPTLFAVEFSPMMLLKGNRLTISEYQRDPSMYRARVSLAAKRDSSSKRSLVAAAFRMSFDDKSDLRTNPDYLKAIDRLTSLRVDIARMRTTARISARLKPVGPYTAEEQVRVDSIEKTLNVDAEQLRLGKAVEAAMADTKRAIESALWNAEVFDFAVGIKGSSADSTGKDSRFDGVAGWLTRGIAIGYNGQILLGARGAYQRDSTEKDMSGVGDAVLRLYVGDNTYKVSGEASATGKASSLPKYAAKIGGEYQAGGALWVEYAFGWSATGSSSGGFTHSVKFHLTPPTL